MCGRSLRQCTRWMYDESDSCRDVVCSSVNERAMVRYFKALVVVLLCRHLVGNKKSVWLCTIQLQYNSSERRVTQLDSVLIFYSLVALLKSINYESLYSYLLYSYHFLLGLISVGPLIIKFAVSYSASACIR